MDEYKKFQANAITKDDYYEASNYLQELANNDNVEAMTELGFCYISRHLIIRHDEEITKEWFKKAAEQGHPIAMYEHGSLLPTEERNIWYEKAFETNDPYVLGHMYYYGNYVGHDNEKSIEYLIESNHPKALNMLGDIYYYGDKGIDIDLIKAFKYFLKSAKMGYSVAQYDVGWCCEHGKGIEKNLTKAYDWHKKAANQNYNSSIIQLETETFKNFDRHENARNALLYLIAIRKFKKDTEFDKVPMDVIKIIAKEIWNTRDSVEWKYELKVTKN